MSEKLVYAYNAVSGMTAEVPERFLKHPVLGKNLREVRTGKPIINAPKIIVDEEVVAVIEEVPTEPSAVVEEDVVTKPASKKTKEKE
jgi:hypothetical protein